MVLAPVITNISQEELSQFGDGSRTPTLPTMRDEEAPVENENTNISQEELSQFGDGSPAPILPTIREQKAPDDGENIFSIGAAQRKLETFKEEDLAKQRQEIKPPSKDEVFADVMSSKTLQEISNKGYTSLAGIALDPALLEKAKTDVGLRATLYEGFSQQYKEPPKLKEDQLAVEFASADLKQVNLPAYFDKYPENVREYLVDIIEKKAGVGEILRESDLPVAAQDIILDDFISGNVLVEAGRMWRDVPSDIAQTLPTLAGMAKDAVASLAMASADYAFTPSDEKLGYREYISNRFNYMQANTYGYLDGLYSFADASVIGQSAIQRFNQRYKKKFIKKYGLDVWRNTHQKAVQELVFDEQGGIVGKRYKTTEKGAPIYEDDFSTVEPVAAKLLDNSFKQLTGSEAMFVWASNIMPLTQVNMFLNVAKGQKYVDKIESFRTSNPEFARGLTDYQLLDAIRRQERNVVFNTFQTTWNRITFGIASAMTAGTIQRGRNMNSFLDGLTEYDDNINSVRQNIVSLENKISNGKTNNINVAQEVSQLKDAKAELAFLIKSKATYTNRSGTGRFINPYSKQALVDDAFIVPALALAPQISGVTFEKLNFNEDVSYMLTALVAPLIAPLTGKTILATGYKTARLVPVGKETTAGLEEMGFALANSDFLSVVTPGMLINNDLKEIRAAADRMGLNLNDNHIKAIDTFSRFLRSAKTDIEITPGGPRLNMQKRIYDSLVNYSNVMDSLKTRMKNIVDSNGNRVLTDAEVADNMANLHLSLAHASGLAPLVALQNMSVKVKPSDMSKGITGASKLEDAYRALAQEEQVFIGMDTQLKILTQSLGSKGIKLDSNDPIQSMIMALENLSVEGRRKIGDKKQLLDARVDEFIKNTDTVDATTVSELTKLRLASGIDSPQTVKDRMDTAEEVAGLLMTRIEERAMSVQAFSTNMSVTEYEAEIQKLSGDLFNTIKGMRYEKARAGYKDLEKYEVTNNIQVNLGNLVGKLFSLDDEYKNKPIDFYFTGGKEFFRQEGALLRQTINKMALQGLKKAGYQDIGTMIETTRMNSSFNGTTPEELAHYIATTRGEDPFSLFVARPSQAEDLRRYFVQRAIRANENKGNLRTEVEIDKEFIEAIDEAVEAVDSSATVFNLLTLSRAHFAKEMGDAFERGTYGGNVERNVLRFETEINPDVKVLDPKTGLPTGVSKEEVSDAIKRERPIYRNPKMRPDYPFQKMAESYKRVFEGKGENTEDALAELRNSMQELMPYLGARRASNGEFAFDLSDETQYKAANTFSQILELMIKQQSEDVLFSSIGKIRGVDYNFPEASLVPPELQARRPKSKVTELQRLKLGEYNFERAAVFSRAHKELRIPVINKKGDFELRYAQNSDLSGEFASVDELLKTNEMYQEGLADIVEQGNTVGSALRTSAKTELDIEGKALQELLGAMGQTANNPSAFFDTYFLNADPTSIMNLKKRLVNEGLNAEEVNTSLAFMYSRGLMEKAGHRYIRNSGMNDALEELSDVSVLIDHTNDPKKFLVMESVLGKEHAGHMKDIANWASFATGDGLNLKGTADTKGMSIDSLIARVFNVARGLVSVEYVTAEVGLRVMLGRNQNLVKALLQDRSIAGVIGKILSNPKAVEKKDIKLLGQRLKVYLLAGEGGILRTEGDVLPALNQLFGIDVPTISERGIMVQEEKEQELLEQERVQ